jgi:hypothetical protein
MKSVWDIAKEARSLAPGESKPFELGIDVAPTTLDLLKTLLSEEGEKSGASFEATTVTDSTRRVRVQRTV